MTSSRPYLLRALHEWIVDNGATPQILVDALNDALEIPDSVRSGEKVVLNISPTAVRDLQMDEEFISFVARFSGVSHAVLVPVDAVLAIYARENGQGMMFPESDDDGVEADDRAGPRPVRGPSGEAGSKRGRAGDVDRDSDPDPDDPGPDDGKGKGRKGRPNLKVIK